mmetsp:Transcript_41152/g.113455  ORF Transcript_41152/g.113455 Transcript_41152/m.113455 type:complete len:230 (-) Transcript_41152:338-1027(-)
MLWRDPPPCAPPHLSLQLVRSPTRDALHDHQARVFNLTSVVLEILKAPQPTAEEDGLVAQKPFRAGEWNVVDAPNVSSHRATRAHADGEAMRVRDTRRVQRLIYNQGERAGITVFNHIQDGGPERPASPDGDQEHATAQTLDWIAEGGEAEARVLPGRAQHGQFQTVHVKEEDEERESEEAQQHAPPGLVEHDAARQHGQRYAQATEIMEEVRRGQEHNAEIFGDCRAV